MAQRPESRIAVREFNGLVSNRGEMLGRPGDALVQSNLYSPSPGQLATRKGRRALSFTGTPGGTGDTLAMYFFRGPDQDYLLTHTDGQDIVLSIAPS
jgi:hypothetical protein